MTEEEKIESWIESWWNRQFDRAFSRAKAAPGKTFTVKRNGVSVSFRVRT